MLHYTVKCLIYIITHKPITVPPQVHMYGNHDHNLISQVG